MANITRTIFPEICSDNDSAFSSDDASSCSSLPEGSLCLSDSAVDTVNMNPFGSFRHQGPLPYSIFNDSSSFSSSPASQRTSMRSRFEDSTHIYINLLDKTNSSLPETTSTSPHRQGNELGPRIPGDGKEDTFRQVVTKHMLSTPSRRHIAKNLKKIGKFLHGASTQSFKMQTLAVL